MRLDKYLKVARILKRRSVAKELTDNGRVKINDKVAKASSEVKVGDQIEVTYGRRILTVKVCDISEIKKKQEAISMYEVLSEETREVDLEKEG